MTNSAAQSSSLQAAQPIRMNSTCDSNSIALSGSDILWRPPHDRVRSRRRHGMAVVAESIFSSFLQCQPRSFDSFDDNCSPLFMSFSLNELKKAVHVRAKFLSNYNAITSLSASELLSHVTLGVVLDALENLKVDDKATHLYISKTLNTNFVDCVQNIVGRLLSDCTTFLTSWKSNALSMFPSKEESRSAIEDGFAMATTCSGDKQSLQAIQPLAVPDKSVAKEAKNWACALEDSSSEIRREVRLAQKGARALLKLLRSKNEDIKSVSDVADRVKVDKSDIKSLGDDISNLKKLTNQTKNNSAGVGGWLIVLAVLHVCANIKTYSAVFEEFKVPVDAAILMGDILHLTIFTHLRQTCNNRVVLPSFSSCKLTTKSANVRNLDATYDWVLLNTTARRGPDFSDLDKISAIDRFSEYVLTADGKTQSKRLLDMLKTKDPRDKVWNNPLGLSSSSNSSSVVSIPDLLNHDFAIRERQRGA